MSDDGVLVLPEAPHGRGRRRLQERRPARSLPHLREASRALEKVEERNEEWDNDPDWNDDDVED